ncbi:hypothetical protein IAU60_003315 [Kwoniella sp. DSM 27419]
MSTSPTKPHYHASRPSSRSGSTQGSPDSAVVRSQAIAKLKRAASLPRKADGRRPSIPLEDGSSSSEIDRGLSAHGQGIPAIHPPIASDTDRDPALGDTDLDERDQQEILSPSPNPSSFDHDSNTYPTMLSPMGMSMQRSASASSSYYTGSPMAQHPNMTANPFFPNTPPVADWAAMQLAQSYLPSLTPTGLSPNPYPHSVPIGVGAGRNTPSPLPTLGEIATLQRSNSNAARARAMSKLTGGSSAGAADEDVTFGTPTRVNLSRAGTLGGARMLDLASLRGRTAAAERPPVPESQFAPALFESRPRLQRSFTVSSSNMGEERRSAVGRRMVERLAERRAAREQQEREVRQLWEQRKGRTEDTGSPCEAAMGQKETPDLGQVSSGEAPPREPHATLAPPSDRDRDLLGVPDRPTSRSTTQSSQEPFEYESHLRRSMSSRTARGNGAVHADPVLAPPLSTDYAHTTSEHLRALQIDDDDETDDAEPLVPPQPSYAVPSRHVQHASTSTNATIQGNDSPGGSSMFSSTMFLVGPGTVPGSTDLRQFSGQHWPQEVHDGSEWGTPAREIQQPTFPDPVGVYSPSEQPSHISQPALPVSPPTVNSSAPFEEEGPPSGESQTDSVMSWEEISGNDNQESSMPSDRQYHQKSNSISAKLKGSVRMAMKKRTQSQTSTASVSQGHSASPHVSPVPMQVGTFPSRRDSESSTSPSKRSSARSYGARHQPSISSLSPSITSPPDAENASLLQHQLGNDPSQVSFLPRASLNDPRILTSKLSPFPGISALDGRKLSDGLLAPEAPKLMHQLSDSAVPSQQRSQSIPTQESIYALPLPAHPDDRRASVDSVGKRNWLSKAFSSATSPRSSGSLTRKASLAEVAGEGRVLGQGAQIISSDVDPFAGPPPPSGQVIKSRKHRSVSPSISVVPELNEEGNRATRFASLSREPGVPLHSHGEASAEGQDALPQKSMDVLSRMDEVLAMGPDDPARPDILDDPPRKLLLSTQVLQVVNVNTVKDRYLFLFNDILVIAKPIISHGIYATLDMKFLVKSIVSLDKLVVSGFTEEPTVEPERHPVVIHFIKRFAENPVSACAYLVERSSPKVDPVTLASLIFKTPELDKTQVGHLLADNEKLMKAFIDRFHFTGVRIDEAFRMFLLSIRLPTEATACESLLRGFAYRYFDANHKLIPFDRDLASDLVLAIMQFNDSLYGTFGFAMPNSAITQETFISAFKSKDPRGLVPVDLLTQIYDSIQMTPLVQALDSAQAHLGKNVQVTPARLPTKLTYNVWSEPMTIALPATDDQFRIKLMGEGLEFDPAVLDFANESSLSFRVKGTSLGTKSLLFDRMGSNAALYGSLGNTRHFNVERAFMKHTFHVAFISHTGLKRKYCFSVNDLGTKRTWGAMLNRQIKTSKVVKGQVAETVQQSVRQTAEAVSIQVLRDALIPPEEKAALGPATVAGGDMSKQGGAGHGPTSGSTKSNERGRAGSVSIAYAQRALKDEAALGPLQATRGGIQGEKQSGIVDVQTGKELVLLCRQNSLLPGLLELLHAGKVGSETMLPTPVTASQPSSHKMDAGRSRGTRV